MNASVRARQCQGELLDDVLENLNLPNRRELNAIIERQHQLESLVKNLSEQVETIYGSEYTRAFGNLNGRS